LTARAREEHAEPLDLARLLAAASRLERKLREAVEAEPALALGAAAGIGFLVGGGLPRGAAALLLGASARLASAWLERTLLAGAGAAGARR
jgi:hypothetical protein